MPIHLKTPAAIEAIIVGPDYAAIPEARKREIARHCQEVPASVLDAVVAVLVGTMTGTERAFTYALFSDAGVDPGGGGGDGGGAGGGGVTSNVRYGLVPITLGADRVQIVFDPPFATQPLGVWCSVQRNGQGENNLAHAGIAELTRAGCVALLSSAAPGVDYRLAWQALPSLGTTSSGPYGDLPMGGSLL